MLYENKSDLYFNDTFKLYKSPFLHEPKYSGLYSKGNKIIVGENTSIKTINTFYSAIGEYVERLGIIVGHINQAKNIEAFSLLNGDIIEVNKDDIYLTGNKHNDSCGVASFINSKKAIENAFLEFIERQSLVDKCVFKLKGNRIHIDDIKNDSIKLMGLLYNYIDEIQLFEISIIKEVPVVLSIGSSSYLKCIGLASSMNINDAIYASLEESLQTFTNVKNKFNYDNEYTDDAHEDMDLYSRYYTKISIEDFKKYYAFLNNSKYTDICRYNDDIKISSAVKRIYELYGVETYCTLINNPLNFSNAKIVKVFSPNGYPHMYPSEDDKFKKSIYSRKRVEPDLNIIPFP
ncbi:YcaO-like family protein [Staphylococcus pseudintermedius]|uniref:YcaO-like family protein n=1 Tax=Staphylococcus pseudintermedius TaxID=283734 RepID=UPI001BE09EFE|nr:YcaO-like family protein [Staphylococcus pseudintermedius]